MLQGRGRQAANNRMLSGAGHDDIGYLNPVTMARLRPHAPRRTIPGLWTLCWTRLWRPSPAPRR
ncbi:hypothetical protein ACRAWD_24550 [Caulobacter segnis]